MKALTDNENGTSRLGSLLSEFSEPATVVKDDEHTENTSDTKPEQEPEKTTAENGQPHWVGNKEYYQSGKKAGQKKPNRTGPKVSYVKDDEPVDAEGDLLVTGAMFLFILDLLFPMLIMMLHNNFDKKAPKIKMEDIQLTKEHKKQLEPYAEKVVKQIKVTANPNVVLGFTMLGMYAMQYAMARMAAKESHKNDKK